ncbi:MAG: TonB-dependent receptor [Bryobacterales bacterium]|nr:TonB-dependent receptor [Bryobacterales bacterium]
MKTLNPFLSILLLSAACLTAQTTGVIQGVVKDSSGLPIHGVTVRVENTQTGDAREAATNDQGRYRILSLLPSTYRVEVRHTGFSPLLRDGIALNAGRSVEVDLQLQISSTTETVVVNAAPPLVSTDSKDWGRVIQSRQVNSLPLIGRDMFDLATQQSGTAVATNARNELHNGTGLKISINGARPNQNSFRMDGIYMSDAAGMAPASAAGRLLGLESIQELAIASSPFSAEFGRAAGSVITAVSRSGGNDFHGSGYWFLRNNAMDARNFFDTETTPPFRRHQFGGAFSGPIHKDRVFFLLNYESLREHRSRTQRALTLTAGARQGILPVPGGATVTVPVNPIIVPYLNLYPMPNGRDFGDGTAEFISEATYRATENFGTARGDIRFNDKLRTSLRYTEDDANASEPDFFQFWTYLYTSRFRFISSETTYTTSASTIYSLRAGHSTVGNRQDATPPLGIPPELTFVPGRPMGNIAVTGLSDLTDQPARASPRVSRFNDLQFNGDVSHIRGIHTLRAGIGYDRLNFAQQSDLTAVGRYRFFSIDELLRVRPRSGEFMDPSSDTSRRWAQHQYHFFLQDELRPTARISLTLGVRYEGYTVPTEADGKVATLRDPYRDTKITVGGPLFTNPSKDNFSPRAALAWRLDHSGRTVLRLGAGMFFDLLGTREVALAGMRVPPFYRRFIGGSNVNFPNLTNSPGAFVTDEAIDGLAYYLRQPYVLQFQANIQHQLTGNTFVQFGYAGTRGVHLVGQYGDLNVVQPVQRADGRLVFPREAGPLNPAFQRIGIRGSDFDSVYHAGSFQLTRNFDHGLRLHFAYTFAKGIDNSSSPAFRDFGESSDRIPTPFNISLQRARSDFDVRHLVSANFNWELPWKAPRAKAILNGWQLHGLFQMQTGFAFNPAIGYDRSLIRSSNSDLEQRPDLAVAPGSKIILGDPQQWFDPLAFSLPEEGVLGNLGRGTLSGPGLMSTNLAAHKEILRRERHSLRLRVETFNLTNHTNLGVPTGRALFASTGRRVASAGRITTTSTPARQLQLALRWEF